MPSKICFETVWTQNQSTKKLVLFLVKVKFVRCQTLKAFIGSGVPSGRVMSDSVAQAEATFLDGWRRRPGRAIAVRRWPNTSIVASAVIGQTRPRPFSICILLLCPNFPTCGIPNRGRTTTLPQKTI